MAARLTTWTGSGTGAGSPPLPADVPRPGTTLGASVSESVWKLAVCAAVGWLLSAAPVQGQAPPAGDLLTIEQATSLALQHNRSIQSNKLDVQKAEDSLAQLRTRRWPALSMNVVEGRVLTPVEFSFPMGAFGMFPSIGPIPPADTTVPSPAQWTTAMIFRVSQPITQLRQIGLGEQQLALGRDLAAERTRGQEQTVVNNVRRLYFGILQTQNAIETREQSLALNEELDRLVRQYIAQGVALPSDGLDVQTLMAKERADLLVSHDTRATLQEQLNALLGRDITTPFTVAEVPDFAGAADDLATLEARALEQRPEVKQAALGLSQAQLDVRVKRADLIPEISATFTYIGLYRFEVLPPHVPTAGVMMTWEPFDWGRKRREIARSEKTVEQASALTQDAEALVRTEVRSSFRKLTQARTFAQVADLAVQAAREKLRVATDLFREQRVLSREVLQAQTALATATQQKNDALLQLGAARADLEKAVGDK